MDDFNKGFASSTSIKPHSVASPSIKDAGGNKSNNENEPNPQTASRLKSPNKKQLLTKNYMNPTISAAVKASVPRKKILGERNEILDTAGSASVQRSSSFGSRSVRSIVVDSDADVEWDVVGESRLEPYDPVTNYLSPRPKFLRYNPDRRRNRRILNLQENDDDRVKISTYFNAGDGTMPSSGLQSSDSCSPQESVEKAQDVYNEEDEGESGEECEVEDDEVMDEFVEDRCCSLKGFFKFLFVVIALILATQYICSMNSPSTHTVESFWGVHDWHNGVYGFNFSEVGYGTVMEPNLLVGRLKEEDAYSHSDRLEVYGTIEELVKVHNEKIDDYVHQDEVGTDDSNVIQDDIFQEHEITATEVIEIDYVEAKAEKDHDSSQDDLIEEDDSNANEKNSQLTDDPEFEIASDMEDVLEEEFDDDSNANEKNSQLTDEAGSETASDMEDGLEEEFDDVKTDNVLIKFTSFDPRVALLVGHILILTSFGVVYHLKGRLSSASVTTPVEKEGLKDVEPSTNPESMIQQKEEEEPFVTSKSISKVQEEDPFVTSTSKVHIPSVELLGELVFGEEVTGSISAKHYSTNSSIQSTAVSSNQTNSSYMETSTGDSHTAKKQGRKPTEVVTPSPVRRSSRLKTRSIISP